MHCPGRILLLSSFLWWAGPVAMDLYSQPAIPLSNPSFEGKPRIGIDEGTAPIDGWTDCGLTLFPGTSPPDLHPLPAKPWYSGVVPVHGQTYLGLVTRSNHTWESLSQSLPTPLQAQVAYTFSCYLVTFPERTIDIDDSPSPAILRIWGGHAPCGRDELLAASPAHASDAWQRHTFTLVPAQTYSYITLEAYYSPQPEGAHSGHLLIDGCSNLVPAQEGDNLPGPETGITGLPVRHQGGGSGPSAPEKQIAVPPIQFETDGAALPLTSIPALEKLAALLISSPGTRIEIGGHTNTIPPDTYCLELSAARAEAVRAFLIGRGVSPAQIVTRGYGKSRPVIPYDKYNRAGRLKNQRVEIRILGAG